MKELLLRQSSAPLQQSSHTPPPDLCALPVDFSYNPPPSPRYIFPRPTSFSSPFLKKNKFDVILIIRFEFKSLYDDTEHVGRTMDTRRIHIYIFFF